MDRQTVESAVKGKKTMHMVNYILADGTWPISLNPEDSDHMDNMAVMESIIGTLVRFEGVGRFYPFLAERWEVLDNGSRYRFYLKSGLKLENGEDIIASTYVKSMKILLKKYGEKERPPIVGDLVGYDEFISGRENMLGLTAPTDSIIEFKFQKNVFGFIEYLATSYFGYYSAKNFDQNGNWLDKQKIISSGPYRLEKISDKELTLAKRGDWPTHRENSPDRIIVSSVPLENALKMEKKNLVIRVFHKKDTQPSDFKDYTVIHGTPTILSYAALSPFIDNGPFKDQTVRKKFAEALQSYFVANLPEIEGVYPTQTFYHSNSQTVPANPEIYAKLSESLKGQTVSWTYSVNKNTKKSIHRELLERFFKELNISNEERPLSTADDKDWYKKFRSKNYADVRLGGVEIGGDVESWMIRMMFCSNLGVVLTDIDDRICKLTDNVENGVIDYPTYKIAFEKTIKEDATVVPLYHLGQTWLCSKDFDLSRLTPTMSTFPFDLVGVND